MGVYNAGYVKLGCSLMVNDILEFHNTMCIMISNDKYKVI